MVRIAWVFPGQGSQKAGMGQSLYESVPEARAVMDTVQAHTRPDLLSVCFHGPTDTLTQTTYTQPGLLAVSLGAMAAFQQAFPELKPIVTAGHSLGEYGALVAAGVLRPDAAARLVAERSRLMSMADAGAMAVVLGLSATQVSQALQNVSGTVVVANDNSPEQVVISGDPAAVEQASSIIKAAGAKRVMSLPVSGAFHSPLMAQAAQQFEAVAQTEVFSAANVPVITNIDAQPTLTGHAGKLANQIAMGVKWTDTITCMVAQYVPDAVIELGSGTVLTGLIKKMAPDIPVFAVGDTESLEAFRVWHQEQLAHV
jgi:[acyl-carrier-protein] S-malonyltransferase